MNSVKIYKYLLLFLIILILLIGAMILTKATLIKQMKVIVFWYLLILELNLINIYSVLSFYEKNKNRKGPKGYKGIVGPRGLKGQSVLCSSCGLSGNDVSKYGRSFGIESEKIKPGRCIFPFMQGYQYANKEETDVDPPFGLPKPKGAHYKGWCATTVDNQFNPVTIAYYDPNLTSQLEAEADLAKMRSQYLQSQMGIIDLKLVYGNTVREAKQMFNNRYQSEGYEFMEQDLNMGTGGKFVHLCVKRGAEASGVKEIKVHYFPNKALADEKDEKGASSKEKDGFKLVNERDEPINLNYDSGSYSKSEDVPHMYLYVKKGNSNFIKDIMVLPDTEKIPAGFAPLQYQPDEEPRDDLSPSDVRETHNNIVDLNRGTHSQTDSPRLLLLVMKNTNIISIDTAFTFTDGAIYMFVANKFYKFSSIQKNKSISLTEGYPKPLQEKWGRLPSLKQNKKNAVESDNCEEFNDNAENCENTLNCFYDSLNKKCEPLSVYNAGFVDQNEDIFFFKGQFVYKYDPVEMKISSGYPKLIDTQFPGLPSNIDAIFVWAKDYTTYAFKGNMHYKIDPKTKKVVRGYPKKNNLRWGGFPDMINAIFSYPTFITRAESKIGKIPKTNNHTYIISQSDVYYIDPNTDQVEKAGHLNDIFTGLEKLSSSQTTFSLKK